MKKLYRNKDNGKLTGLCAGMAEHFNTDPILFRVAFVMGVLILGIGILPYIILSLIIPESPYQN
jgi:phage shock protein C